MFFANNYIGKNLVKKDKVQSQKIDQISSIQKTCLSIKTLASKRFLS